MKKLILTTLCLVVLYFGETITSQENKGKNAQIFATPLTMRGLVSSMKEYGRLIEKDDSLNSCVLVYFNSVYYPGIQFKLELNDKHGTIQSTFEPQIDTLSRYAHYWILRYVKELCIEGKPMIIKKERLDNIKIADWPRLSITGFNKEGKILFDKQNLPVTQRDEDYNYEYSQVYEDLIEYVDVLSKNLSIRINDSLKNYKYY